MEFKLTINPEFQEKIPPLTQAEFDQLEENILEAGKIYEPIVVWNGTIVDGHNRYKIAQKHPEITWETREMEFADKWAAFDWMFRNQLGRRNLTDGQRTYILGKMYEARKHIHGGNRGNQYTKVGNGRKTAVARHTDGVSKIVAEELGIGKTTVKDAGNYAKGIDTIKEEDPELAESILNGKKRVQKKTIQNVGRADSETKDAIIKAIKEDRKVPMLKTPEEVRERRKDMAQINKFIKESYATGGVAVMTLDDLITDIKVNTEPYIKLLNRIISGYEDVVNSNADTIVKTIDKFAIDEINRIKERIRNNGT